MWKFFVRDGVTHIVKMNSDNLAGKFNYLMKGKAFPSKDDINNAVKTQAAKKFLANDCD